MQRQKDSYTICNSVLLHQFSQQVQPFSRQQQLTMTHLNPSKALPLFSDKEQQCNVISQHLQSWSKNTSSRFGLKLYIFTPKKHVTPIKSEAELPDNTIFEDANKEPQQMKKQIELTTPQQRSQNKQKKNRATATHTKQQSESSSEYMPTKSSKTIKKRLSKKATKQIKKAILF